MTVRNFLMTILLGISSMYTNAQVFKNLQFEESCTDTKTKLCHWEVSWNYKMESIGGAASNQRKTLLLHSQAENGIGYVEQGATVSTPTLKLITFRGKLKTEKVQGKGAGVTINAFDAAGNYLFMNDFEKDGQQSLTGTNEWQPFQLQAVIGPSTTKVKIGVILYGSGKAWFDDFSVEIQDLSGNQPNTLAREYIEAFCKIVAVHSLRKDSIDLDLLKNRAFTIAGAATQPADCYLAVRYIISQLGDHHSFFMTPKDYNDWQNTTTVQENIPMPEHRLIKNFGYISLPGFHSGDEKLMVNYIDSIQLALAYFDRINVDGWIVDLRSNDGGNMEPMLSGLGPLFSAKTLGYLVNVHGEKEPWGYRKNAAFSGKDRGVSATQPVKLKHKNLPIAVLTGPRTGSSGEIIVLSFVGNKHTKSFGQPTFGVSTGNGEFKLPDGARVFLTSTVMADRTGKLYGGKVVPDVWIKEVSKDDDPELMEAIRWLEQEQ